MSWLRDHFHNFVFPAFVAAGQRTDKLGEPFDVRPSKHAPERLPTELKKLWTLCQEHKVPWAYDVREINYFGGSSKHRENARIHHRILNNTIDSAMAALRHEGCDRLFLGGRDVWTFAVLCERRRIPYMFVPELSRNVAHSPLVKPFLESRGFTGKELFLDTGFAGSIPKSLANHFEGIQFRFRLMSQSDQFLEVKTKIIDGDPNKGELPHRTLERWRRRPNQLFPNRAKARDEALETEYLAKYWKAGAITSGHPLGSAPYVFQDWVKRPDVRRFSDPQRRHLGLHDGKESIVVSLTDVKIAPGFYEWWQKLPECPMPKAEDEVAQYFSSKATIQRAALLTSQLWRGIPYWKTAQSKNVQYEDSDSDSGPVKYASKYQSSSGMIVGSTASTSAVTTFTNGATNIVWDATGGGIGFNQAQAVVYGPGVDHGTATAATVAMLKAIAQKQKNMEEAEDSDEDEVKMTAEEAEFWDSHKVDEDCCENEIPVFEDAESSV